MSQAAFESRCQVLNYALLPKGLSLAGTGQTWLVEGRVGSSSQERKRRPEEMERGETAEQETAGRRDRGGKVSGWLWLATSEETPTSGRWE